MDRIEREALSVRCSRLANGLVGHEPLEGPQSSAEIVGIDEVGQVASELVVRFVVEAWDGCIFKRSVHAFDLAVGPRVTRLGQAVVDVVLRAGILEGMRKEEFTIVHGASDVGGG